MRRSRGSFDQRVVAVVRRIPRGRVATYGSVAAACGLPRAARQVGWVLRHTHGHCPWQRVINREGRLSIAHPYLTPALQASFLRKDGVRVTKRQGTYWVDLDRYVWKPKRAHSN